MLRSLRLFVLLVGFAAGTAGCLETSGPSRSGRSIVEFPDGKIRILFIGNSLTYVNDLPAMVVAVAKQAGDDQLAAGMVAFPDFDLELHWAEGSARESLEKAKWEFVVMQQGPSSQPQNQLHLATWSARFAPLIRAAGAEPVLYMVWPSRLRSGDFPGVRESYRNAAAGIAGIFAPAGDAWTASFAVDPQSPLYAPDAFHPSAFGTYLAAIVLLERIRGIDPTTLPGTIPGMTGIPEAAVRALQQAARVALDRNESRP